MRNLVPSLFLLMLVLTNFSCKVSPVPDNKGKPLYSFESAAEVEAVEARNCTIAAVAEHATDGSSAIRVLTEGGDKPEIEFVPAQGSWNWTGFDRLAVDVFNPTGDEVGLRIRLDDDPAATEAVHSVSGGTTIPPGLLGQRLPPVRAATVPPKRGCGSIVDSRCGAADLPVHGSARSTSRTWFAWRSFVKHRGS